MKSLYESLLDDFDEIVDRQDDSLREEILKGTWFRLGSDMKTIIFDPEAFARNGGGKPRLFDTLPRLWWVKGKSYENNISDISICKDLGLKFQPLAYISNEVVGDDADWLKYFDCEYAVVFNLAVRRNTHPTIDMSKIKFPIKGRVSFSGYSSIEKVIAYPRRLETVHFIVQVHQPITGWSCETMVIGNTNNIIFDLTKHDRNMSHEEKMQKLTEWVDELLKNNPYTETIYLGQFDSFSDCRKVQVKGSGANRKCVGFNKISYEKHNTLFHKNSAIRKMEEDVVNWKWQHMDLYEYEGSIATTIGNTMGMGNPMPADVGTEGSEPLPDATTAKVAKKKKKRIKESLLDDIDDIADDGDKLIEVENWVSIHINNVSNKKPIIKKYGDKYKVIIDSFYPTVVLDQEIPDYILLDITRTRYTDFELNNPKWSSNKPWILNSNNILSNKSAHIYLTIGSDTLIDKLELVGEFNCKQLHIENNSNNKNCGVKNIIIHKDFNCNWTVLGGCYLLKSICCIDGHPRVTQERFMLPDTPVEFKNI